MLHSLVQSVMPLVAAALALVMALIGFDTVPTPLAAMADTERAFARRAADTSIHAAFVEFFADEAVSFNPDPGPARERLRKQPDAFPKGLRMVWEPRVSARIGRRVDARPRHRDDEHAAEKRNRRVARRRWRVASGC